MQQVSFFAQATSSALDFHLYGCMQILQEAAIMRVCAHKHCVELLEAHQGTTTGAVYLVMENVEHSLAREILLNPRGLPLAKAKLIAFQLAQALELVHRKEVGARCCG